MNIYTMNNNKIWLLYYSDHHWWFGISAKLLKCLLINLILSEVNLSHSSQIFFLRLFICKNSSDGAYKADSGGNSGCYFILFRRFLVFTIIGLLIRVRARVAAFIRVVFHKESCKDFKVSSIVFDVFGTGLLLYLVFELLDSFLDDGKSFKF